MSQQTKSQAIGYMTLALFEAGANADQLKNFIHAANKSLATNGNFDNYNTREFLEQYIFNSPDFHFQVVEGMAIDHKKENFVTKVKSALYWAHDDKTVEDAGAIYTGFCEIFGLYRYLQEPSELEKTKQLLNDALIKISRLNVEISRLKQKEEEQE